MACSAMARRVASEPSHVIPRRNDAPVCPCGLAATCSEAVCITRVDYLAHAMQSHQFSGIIVIGTKRGPWEPQPGSPSCIIRKLEVKLTAQHAVTILGRC